MRDRSGGRARGTIKWGEGERRGQVLMVWGNVVRERGRGRAALMGEWGEGEKKGQGWMDG